MTVSALFDLLRVEGLAPATAEGSDAIGVPSTNVVPPVESWRDTGGTLKRSCDAVSRLSRLSRQKKTMLEGGVEENAVETGAGGAGEAVDSFARGGVADRLRRAAKVAGVDPDRVLTLNDASGDELVTMPTAVLVAYARSLIEQAEVMAGRTPGGWTVQARCDGCGPVLLGPGSPSRVVSCPWCWRRVGGAGC